MTVTNHRTASLAVTFVFFWSTAIFAATVSITSLGDEGWISGDTRAAGYLDVHGDTQVVSGRNVMEDALIADRIAFTAAPGNSPLGNGALRLTTYVTDDKATLALPAWSDPFGVDLSIEYAWFVAGDATPTVAAPAVKIGIDTIETNSMSDLSVDRREDSFDKILVYEPYFNGPQIDDLWKQENITPAVGRFWLVNLNTPSALSEGGAGDLRTLAEWATEFDTAGLAGATMTSLQLGVGSGNLDQVSYVDYLIYSNVGQASTTMWDFDGPAIPVPSSTGLLGFILSVLVGLLGVWVLSRSPTRAA
jgi:hypothetical protein